MSVLTPATRRRLLKLPQIPSVWEGDRRSINLDSEMPEGLVDLSEEVSTGDCILWADGGQGMVRSMDIVPAESGSEPVVRALLKAMEQPQGPGSPARPQKIVVRDRELQFFLRGVLQDLEIVVDCVPNLPLLDEIFEHLQQTLGARRPSLPPELSEALRKSAKAIWDLAPWELLEDHQILSLELKQWDIDTLYVSIMGMLGMEYGLLLYRSLESLRRFRSTVLEDDRNPQQLEAAFLAQDCLYLTYDSETEDDDDDLDLADLPWSEIDPTCGNLHPFEGMRPFLYQEEALAMVASLQALEKFFRQHRRKLSGDKFPSLSSQYPVTLPSEHQLQQALTITVSTLPDLATEFLAMMEDEDEDGLPDFEPILRDDLIPEDALFSVSSLPWDVWTTMRPQLECYQAASQAFPNTGEGLPIFLVQTSRPKAKLMIEHIQSEGGVKALCFNTGTEPFQGDRFDLPTLQTTEGVLYLCGEFLQTDPTHKEARKRWEQLCKATNGHCGLVIAKGRTGGSRGKPQVKDMMGLYEVPYVSAQDLGLGTLQMMPFFGP
jgi:hypothetical protein